MLSSYWYRCAVSPCPRWFLANGHCSKITSLSTSSTWNTFRLACMSVMPGSQYRFSRSTSRRSMSPRPPSLAPFQNTPFTAVPCFSLYHQASLYTCSYSFWSSATGNMLESSLAVSASSRARGSTLGSG